MVLTEFDERIFNFNLNKAAVYHDGSITFLLENEITIVEDKGLIL